MQDPVVLRWWEGKAKRDEEEERAMGLESPRMTRRYLELETAALFGMGIDGFRRTAMEYRAEMMAHLVIKGQREAYLHYLEERKSKLRKKSGGGGFNPAERQRREWML